VALLWAKQRGFFDEEGLNVRLIKEASWASLRDRLAFGLLDAAHCLSAMLPAAAIGNDQIGIPLQTPLVLSESRAFISLSQKLCYQLQIQKDDT
ncbi:ABC transporter substrate-binding protein, partial [Pseudomonas asgharzadehiana]